MGRYDVKQIDPEVFERLAVYGIDYPSSLSAFLESIRDGSFPLTNDVLPKDPRQFRPRGLESWRDRKAAKMLVRSSQIPMAVVIP